MQRRMRAKRKSWRERIARELVDARKKEGASVREVARKTGLPYSVIARAESGTHNFTIDTLEQIATGMGLEFTLRRRR